MTETEWLLCNDLQAMLLDRFGQDASSRKLHLFTCACYRRVYHRIVDERVRSAIEIVERYADGLASRYELEAVGGDHIASDAAQESGWYSAWYAASGAAHYAVDRKAERKEYTNLLREVLGNPFLRVSVHPSWIVWNDGAIQKIAQTIYTNRAFDRLPLLADALEDAGCDNADILSHCRTPGEHVRGCWVIDLLLGKN